MSQRKGKVPAHIKPKLFDHPGRASRIISTLCEVEDSRQPSCNFRHSLVSIIFISLTGILCGAKDWEEIVQAANGMFDYLGYLTFLGVIFSALLLTMNVKAPWNTQGWYSTYAITHASIIIAASIAFLYFELTVDDPLFLLRHFTIRPFLLAAISMFFLGGIIFGTPVFFSQVLHDDLQWANIQVGYHFAIFGVAIGISGALTGILSNVIGIRWPAAIGLILVTISCFMNHNFTIYSDHIDLYLILIIRGMGIGIALGPITSLGLIRIPKQPALEIAKATVMLTILRQMGAAFASNLLNIVITQREKFHKVRFGEMVNPQSAAYRSVVSALEDAAASRLGSPHGTGRLLSSQELMSLIQRQAHVAAFDDAFFDAGIVIGLVTLVLTSLMIHRYVRVKFGKPTFEVKKQ